jgi:hypothetical protein
LEEVTEETVLTAFVDPGTHEPPAAISEANAIAEACKVYWGANKKLI